MATDLNPVTEQLLHGTKGVPAKYHDWVIGHYHHIQVGPCLLSPLRVTRAMQHYWLTDWVIKSPYGYGIVLGHRLHFSGGRPQVTWEHEVTLPDQRGEGSLAHVLDLAAQHRTPWPASDPASVRHLRKIGLEDYLEAWYCSRLLRKASEAVLEAGPELAQYRPHDP